MKKLNIKKIYNNCNMLLESELTETTLNEKIKTKSTVDKLKDRLAEYFRKIPGTKLVKYVADATNTSTLGVLKGAAENIASIGKNGAASLFNFIKDATVNTAKKASDAIDNAARTDDEKKAHQEEQDKKNNEEKEKLEVKDLELDPHKTTFNCIFDHGDAAALEKVIKTINEEKEKNAKLVNDIAKQLPEQLKKAGCPDISKETMTKYGLAIAGLIAKGYKKDKLKKAIEEMEKKKETVENSINTKNESLNESQLLNENMLLTGLNMALSLVGLGIGNNTENYSLMAGEFTSIAGGVETHSMYEHFVEGPKKFSMDGVSGSAETATAGAALWVLAALKTVKIIIRHRKEINDVLQNQANKFAKQRNVIANMEFFYDDTKYTVNYNVKNNKWIIMDRDNPKEKVDKSILKSALDSDMGKKFREYCQKIWDPIFKPTGDNKESMFTFIMQNNDELKLKLKVPKDLIQIGKDYDRIIKTGMSDNYNI